MRLVVPCLVSRFSSARVPKDRWAPQVRPQAVRFVRASVVRCTPLVLPPVAVPQVWVGRAWLRRRLQDRPARRAVVRDSAMFLEELKKDQ